MISERTLKEIFWLPRLQKEPLQWTMEDDTVLQGPNLLWLEFGVWKGGSINYISRFTEQQVYGFDSFQGLPEDWRTNFNKGTFDLGGALPRVSENVELIPGWFSDTLPEFLQKHKQKQISFVHLDADLYSSTKFVLSSIALCLCNDAVLVFDELINYEGFDGNNGELRAWDEFINEWEVDYSWIGGYGDFGNFETCNEKAAVRIHSVRPKV